MPIIRPIAATTAALLLGLAPALVEASCGAAFCSVNTSSDFLRQGLAGSTRVDLRFEFIDQKQPRHGTDAVAVGEISAHHDEVRTLNRNWIASVEHDLAADWRLAVAMPLVDRSHEHIHNHHHDGEVLHIHDSWNFTEVGDLRVLARHELVAGHHRSVGVSFGLKLPTGATDVDNDDGDAAERSLQPGTGTTDLLLGTQFRQALAGGDQLFASLSGEWATGAHDGYRPGHRLHLDLGWQLGLGERLSLPLQLNVAVKGRDRGDEAEPEDSGGTTVALAPGVSYLVSPGWMIYGAWQKPIYQDVNGVQLTANWSAVLGTTLAF
ncbi:MAG: transporter [Rhodocyclaceae bacterium]|nr:transporter [Rhodocyclaceae bacterium]